MGLSEKASFSFFLPLKLWNHSSSSSSLFLERWKSVDHSWKSVRRRGRRRRIILPREVESSTLHPHLLAPKGKEEEEEEGERRAITVLCSTRTSIYSYIYDHFPKRKKCVLRDRLHKIPNTSSPPVQIQSLSPPKPPG